MSSEKFLCHFNLIFSIMPYKVVHDHCAALCTDVTGETAVSDEIQKHLLLAENVLVGLVFIK